jgi:hypothetical protein
MEQGITACKPRDSFQDEPAVLPKSGEDMVGWWVGVSCHCSSLQDGENQRRQGCDWPVLLLTQKFPRRSK